MGPGIVGSQRRSTPLTAVFFLDAVLNERPQWAISACKDQAEPIIEQGQHDSYRTAVRWLERAGKAARTAGECNEWRGYIEDLQDEHHRKYKFRRCWMTC